MPTAIIEDLFEMANLSPQRTGLPFVVWISPRAGAQHDIRVKVSPGPRAIPGEFVSVAIRPSVRVIAGQMKGWELALLERWIALNLEVLVKYWDGVIEYTEDAIAALHPLE